MQLPAVAMVERSCREALASTTNATPQAKETSKHRSLAERRGSLPFPCFALPSSDIINDEDLREESLTSASLDSLFESHTFLNLSLQDSPDTHACTESGRVEPEGGHPKTDNRVCSTSHHELGCSSCMPAIGSNRGRLSDGITSAIKVWHAGRENAANTTKTEETTFKQPSTTSPCLQSVHYTFNQMLPTLS
eukprot:m.149183 g.149183  ORF g.149183 m.149183 type:complete len:192 (-) comp16155_c0_seq1:187-762(-)